MILSVWHARKAGIGALSTCGLSVARTRKLLQQPLKTGLVTSGIFRILPFVKDGRAESVHNCSRALAGSGWADQTVEAQVAQAGRADDVGYFQRRAEQEIELAQSAAHPAAVRAHYDLAGYYLDHVYNGSDSAVRPRNRFEQ